MTNHPLPEISVVMPCYNAGRFLREAVESVLGQTLRDFELIVINDASTDDTKLILKEYQSKDGRIVYLEHEKNRGVSASLNEGLRHARGEFIARMDADDIAEPDRFEKQTARFYSHPELFVCGTWLRVINEKGEAIGQRSYEANDRVLKKRILRRSPFAHPSVMIRRSVLARHDFEYSEQYPCAEDYDLWLRLMPYGGFANVPEPLVRYRLYDGAVKNRHCKTALWSTLRLKTRYLKYADFLSYGILCLELALMALPASWILDLFKKYHGIKK